MGCLIDGVWTDRWYDTSKSGGRFLREDSQLRNWITPDGTPGPSGEGGFRAEVDRYHLYVSLACPWAHRIIITREGAMDELLVQVEGKKKVYEKYPLLHHNQEGMEYLRK